MRRLVCITSLLLSAIDTRGATELWSLHPVPNEFQHGSIDAFVRAGLEGKGLQSSPAADRRTLIRRATYDLTGLPPTATEARAFADDASPQAYERLIERLLASPHYGEHWARHWLDVARYSDTKGYVYAREEKMWVHATPYRDWVVRALNNDLPYDRFLKLQIAADQLVLPASPDLAAMGFLTLGRRFLGVTHDIIDDRIDVVTRGTLGLTVACARCHDHKFDPIPTRDYYALYGVFQSSAEALVPCTEVSSPELKTLIKENQDLLTKRRNEQMARTRSQVREHLEAQFELDKYPEEAFGQILDVKDLNPFIVRRWQTYLSNALKDGDPAFTAWHAFTKAKPASFSQVWSQLRPAPAGSVHPAVMRAFAKAPADMSEVARVYAEVLQQPEFKAILEGSASPCFVPDEHIANIEMYFPTSVIVELWQSQAKVDRFIITKQGAPAYATVLQDRAEPVTPRVFNRGNPLTKGDEVPRQFLSSLGNGKPFIHGSGRLELADAIASPDNPLTARVMVNRIWQHHFGRGIVSTPSDFGKQGSAPSHPELLDWLAREFIHSGWSIKAMHRLIMRSQTYQQSSTAPQTAAQQTDPDNRLLWRMNPHRLGFEEARDTWLTAAGHLDLRIGGRPSALFANDHLRRTLYTLVDRESLPGVLRAFDFANPDLSIPQRTETTVPQQALFAMNHPFVVAQVKALLNQPEIATADATTRVKRLYERLYQRRPASDELNAALDYVAADTAPVLAAVDHSQSWQYGYGEWDEAAGRVKEFHPLPHFAGSAWQGDAAWPNEKLGWAQLTANGGHPGNNRQHAVVRRWVAPADGTYYVRSALLHEPKAGDGIRAFVSHGKQGPLASLKVHGDKADLNFDSITFQAGDTLDFVVDIDRVLNSDQFLWAPRIQQSASAGSGGDVEAETWDAEKDFYAQPMSSLNSWEQLTQVLMLANELMFVD